MVYLMTTTMKKARALFRLADGQIMNKGFLAPFTDDGKN